MINHNNELCLKQHAGTRIISDMGTQFAALLGGVSNSLYAARI
jgi:hypothetical protein